jgi:hypothetical protein
MKPILYKDFKNEIEYLARKWNKQTGLPFEEFIGQGNLAFAKCKRNYRPKNGSFIPYFKAVIKSNILEFVRSHNFNTVEYREEADESRALRPDDKLYFQDMLEHLSKEAYTVVSLVLNGPPDLQDMFAEVGKPTKGTIRTYLRKLKWSHCKIDRIFTELKQELTA